MVTVTAESALSALKSLGRKRYTAKQISEQIGANISTRATASALTTAHKRGQVVCKYDSRIGLWMYKLA